MNSFIVVESTSLVFRTSTRALVKARFVHGEIISHCCGARLFESEEVQLS